MNGTKPWTKTFRTLKNKTESLVHQPGSIGSDEIMSTKKNKKEAVERKEAFKSLPENIKQTLTDEEINAFLHKEVWPETLFEKLRDFIVRTDD